MRQRPLTKEQREMLSRSPHVIKMTDVYVFFSSSFINKFCVDYHVCKTVESIDGFWNDIVMVFELTNTPAEFFPDF